MNKFLKTLSAFLVITLFTLFSFGCSETSAEPEEEVSVEEDVENTETTEYIQVSEDEEIITIDNCEEFRSLLNSDWNDNTEEQWDAFFKENKGRTIEFDGVMMYNYVMEEGSFRYNIGFYVEHNGDVNFEPSFYYDTSTVHTKGLENFDFKDSADLDGQRVHVKLEIKRYDNDLDFCKVKLISVEPRA